MWFEGGLFSRCPRVGCVDANADDDIDDDDDAARCNNKSPMLKRETSKCGEGEDHGWLRGCDLKEKGRSRRGQGEAFPHKTRRDASTSAVTFSTRHHIIAEGGTIMGKK